MLSFTLKRYKQYLEILKSKYNNVITFSDYFDLKVSPKRFLIIRHDVDRKPFNSLNMAKLESSMGIRSTYYFRDKSNVFVPSIIKAISAMGHEVGYHYECLSDSNGKLPEALKLFEQGINKFNKLVKVKTISMHGRPLSRVDNRDLWRQPNKDAVFKAMGVMGEVYLDVSYDDIAYIGDTGRNWQNKFNIRDKVNSSINLRFKNDNELLEYLRNAPNDKLVFQIHPERWSNNLVDHGLQMVKDYLINFSKMVIRIVR